MKSRKRKSTYTKPKLRETLKNRILSGSLGGRSGQWSARKAQLLAVAYKKNGGGYKGGKSKTQRSLSKWTQEKWTTSDNKPAIRIGGTTRYLPQKAWEKLTPAQKLATNAKKKKGSKLGKQFIANTQAAAAARRSVTKSMPIDQNLEIKVMGVFNQVRIKSDKKMQEALDVAKMIGCSGVHKGSNGEWMPCSSVDELDRISNTAEGNSWRTVVPESENVSSRAKGQTRKRRQKEWDNLEEKPIRGIVGVAGLGIVSGKGIGPDYVNENSQDVFVDPESARARSRQLGCIGISRRMSKNGRVVWMPCTNMSDYANRTGSTFLGRRNIQKRDKDRIESMTRTVMAKKKPKVPLSSRLNIKK